MKNRLINAGMIVLFGLSVVSGCASPGPILLEFQYRAPQDVAAAGAKTVVGVCPFKDDRGGVNSVIGKRSVEATNETNDLVIQGTAADKVATALKASLKARAIAYKDCSAWDLTEAGIPSDGAGLVISGEIKKLWVDAASRFANTTIKADVQIRVSVADPAQKKVIRVMNVSSAMERQSLAFSTSMVAETVADALSSAMDQIFKDEELKKKL